MKNFIKLSILLIALFSVICCNSTKVETSNDKPVASSNTSKKAPTEYERATKDLVGETISIEEFQNDKKEVMSKISELNSIMKDYNYKAWLPYIDKASINYWSQRANLNAASKKLPVKGIQLKSLQDYFTYVFIPSRMGRDIDEIRYISSTSIKAVQVRDNDIVIFYNFVKRNGTWYVELPILN